VQQLLVEAGTGFHPMQSMFDTALASGLGPIYDVMGERVTYTPRGGGPVDVVAIVDRDLSRHGDDLEIVDGALEIIFRTEDVPDTPQRGAQITVEGVSFTVHNIVASDRHEHRLIAA